MKMFSGKMRRVAVGLFLAAALLMLVLGMTVLSQRLSGVGLMIYWLICFVLTGLAALGALIDMTLIRRELREEQRKLIETTLADAKIESSEVKKTLPKN
jgi:hypothetical protein